MLRQLVAAARPAQPALAAAARRTMAGGPAGSVTDLKVSCTFIMAKQKQKITVPGMVGWSLLQTAHHHGFLEHCVHDDGAYDYVNFGEGAVNLRPWV